MLERFPRARFDTWSATGEGAQRAGAAIAFGRPLDATYDVAKADVILSLDSDFLAVEGEHLRHAREFASRREGDRMNRLYVAEPRFSVTGGMADHRLRMRGLEVAAFARAVAAELAARGARRARRRSARTARASGRRSPGRSRRTSPAPAGRSLVLAGARQPPAVHALAAAMNEALGNVGTTVHWRAPVLLDPRAGADSLRELAGELAAGKIDTLVVTAWNALHTAPADLELRKAFGKVKNSMVLALREDETVRAASWRLAASHPLESWGDLRARDGTVSIVQPLITPLYESATEIDLLAAFVGEGDRGAWRLVREGWRTRSGAPPAPLPLAGAAAAANPVDTNRPRPPDPYDRTWDEWLAAGVLTESAGRPEQVAADLGSVGDALGKLPVPAGGIELGLRARLQDLRRPPPRERLAAGAPGSRDEAHLGQRRPPLARDGEAARPRARAISSSSRAAGAPSWRRCWSCRATPTTR